MTQILALGQGSPALKERLVLQTNHHWVTVHFLPSPAPYWLHASFWAALCVAFKAPFHLRVGTFANKTTLLLKAGKKDLTWKWTVTSWQCRHLYAATPTFKGRLGDKVIYALSLNQLEMGFFLSRWIIWKWFWKCNAKKPVFFSFFWPWKYILLSRVWLMLNVTFCKVAWQVNLWHFHIRTYQAVAVYVFDEVFFVRSWYVFPELL